MFVSQFLLFDSALLLLFRQKLRLLRAQSCLFRQFALLLSDLLFSTLLRLGRLARLSLLCGHLRERFALALLRLFLVAALLLRNTIALIQTRLNEPALALAERLGRGSGELALRFF